MQVPQLGKGRFFFGEGKPLLKNRQAKGYQLVLNLSTGGPSSNRVSEPFRLLEPSKVAIVSFT